MESCIFEPVYRKYFPFREHLSENDRASFCRSSVNISYPKGTTIHAGNG